ncbi:MAG: hypothetical protein GY853_03550 [PVC group bacterium]|nr:hypothetical protein [PVC group bacterium]
MMKNREKIDRENGLISNYLKEMEELINRYPEDPNECDFSEDKLNELMSDIDKSWKAFNRKWQHKISLPKKDKGLGVIKKDDKGMHHLVIKSDVIKEPILDLVVPEEDAIES